MVRRFTWTERRLRATEVECLPRTDAPPVEEKDIDGPGDQLQWGARPGRGTDAGRLSTGDGRQEAENKIWHAHPVWFLEGNPIVGYSKLKNCVRLLFWSGQSFKEKGLKKEGTFKAAEARYTAVDQGRPPDLPRQMA